jgi:hypothetical protein
MSKKAAAAEFAGTAIAIDDLDLVHSESRHIAHARLVGFTVCAEDVEQNPLQSALSPRFRDRKKWQGCPRMQAVFPAR